MAASRVDPTRCLDTFKRRDHEEAVRLLGLQDPKVLSWYHPGLLYYSIRNGWLDVTRDLVTSYRFDPHQYYNEESYLYTAANGNHVDIVGYLIKECGCDPMRNTAIRYGSVPVLHYVAIQGLDLLDVLKCMVMNINGHIMDKQYCTISGRTVLHRAVRHIDVVKYLINQCNCDIMTRDNNGNTILHDAAREGLLDVMKYLINTHHCNPMTTNYSGQTVLHCAVRHIDVVKYLINEHNCDHIMTPDKDGNTILHVAAIEGLLNVMKYLINARHCNLMTTNNKGQTVLHRAVKYIDVVKYLINQCNCDIMVTDENGQTPLHHAAREGTPEVVEFLLSTGNCDPLAKDKWVLTPLQLAKERGYNSGTVIDIFKNFGDIKISHPIDSYINVLLVGNPGAGKSTFSHVINDTATGSIVLGSFRNVGGVVPCQYCWHHSL